MLSGTTPPQLLLLAWLLLWRAEVTLAQVTDSQSRGRENDPPAEAVRLPGDVTFGGLFPMHEHTSRGGRASCGKIKTEKGIQRMEAMLWAVDEINRSQELLPNITIGVRILDTCSSGTYALEQSMEFVKSNMNQVGLNAWLSSRAGTALDVPCLDDSYTMYD